MEVGKSSQAQSTCLNGKLRANKQKCGTKRTPDNLREEEDVDSFAEGAGSSSVLLRQSPETLLLQLFNLGHALFDARLEDGFLVRCVGSVVSMGAWGVGEKPARYEDGGDGSGPLSLGEEARRQPGGNTNPIEGHACRRWQRR